MKENKILLHACCAICSGYPISFLKDEGFEPVVYFFNPNIQPIVEYLKRLDAQRKLCSSLDCELIVEDYMPSEFNKIAQGLEKEPEGGKRCVECFELRLLQSAKKAQELGIENFTTSIVISPHKNFELISNIGKTVSAQYNLNYFDFNFRKNDGTLKTNKIAKELGLYRQNYCGCLFSFSGESETKGKV